MSFNIEDLKDTPNGEETGPFRFDDEKTNYNDGATRSSWGEGAY